MGLINAITKIEELEAEGVIWAERFYEIVQLLFVFLKLHSMRRMMGLRYSRIIWIHNSIILFD